MISSPAGSIASAVEIYSRGDGELPPDTTESEGTIFMGERTVRGSMPGDAGGPLGGGDRSFSGIRTLFRLPHPRDLESARGADFAAVGLPFDTGTSYRPGARFGPAAIREISSLVRPYNTVLDVSIADHLEGVDLGDAPVVSGNTPASLERMTISVAAVTEMGILPVGLGGDHTVTLAMLRAVAAQHGPVALLQFDSHPDTWDTLYGESYNHGTPFRRAIDEGLIRPERSVQLGLRGSMLNRDVLDYSRDAGFTMVPAEELLGRPAAEIAALVSQTVRDSPVYVTFDIDFLDPAFAPGTGTPEIGGPTTAQALAYLRALDFAGVVGMDCVEVLPAFDVSGITALAAATVIGEMLGLVVLGRRAGG